jgi:flagellar hook-length control protein FliK
MNEPVIDNLFSVAAPLSDVSLAVGSRRTEDISQFDDHLRQAGIPGSAPSLQPWWRSSFDRRDTDQRSPDFIEPPPRSFDPPADLSPPSDSASTAESAPAAKTDDGPIEHGADQTAAEAAVAAAAEHGPARNAPDRPAADEPSTSDLPRGEKASAERPEKAKPGTPADKNANAAASETPTTPADAKSAIRSLTGSSTSALQSDQTADAQASAKDRLEKPADANTTTKSAKSEAALQQAAQTTPATPLAVAAVATNEAASAAADGSEPTATTRPNKVTAGRGVPTQKRPTRSAAPSSRQSTAVESTTTDTKTGDASADPAAAKAKTAAKPDAKQQDSASAADTSSAEPSRQVAQVRTNSNQSTPSVAAITTANAAEKATANDSAAETNAKVAKTSAAPKSATLAAFGRLDRDGLLTARGPRQAGETPDAPRVDPARFVSRVARAIETAQDRGGSINLRLSPPELGSLRLQLDVKQGVMNAKVETDTAAARQALLDNLPSLRERLAEQNVRIERFDVDVRRDGQGDQANPGPHQQSQFQQHQQYYQAPSTRPATAPAGHAEDAAAEPVPAVRTITDTTINLVA